MLRTVALSPDCRALLARQHVPASIEDRYSRMRGIDILPLLREKETRLPARRSGSHYQQRHCAKSTCVLGVSAFSVALGYFSAFSSSE